MQYTNDDILKIKYVVESKSMKKIYRAVISNLIRKIKRNKWITITIMALVIFSTINFTMIYKFISLLQQLN